MHVCPECGKTMATAGGLEIHGELAHAAPPPQPVDPEPGALEPVELEVAVSHQRPQAWPPMPADGAPAASTRTYKPFLRGWDPTLPLTAVLVVALLLAGIAAAIGRSANGPATSVSAAAAPPAGSSSGTPGTAPTVPPATSSPTAPDATTPLTQPPLFGGRSSTAAATQPAAPSACQSVVNSLSTRVSKRTADPAELIKANGVPSLPLPGFGNPTPRYVDVYASADEYIAKALDPADPTTPAWVQMLRGNGFVSAASITLVEQDTAFQATAFRFATPAGAAAFNRATLSAACAEGILQNPKPMASLSGGMNYLIVEPGGPPFRATFVAGDTVMRMNICHCAQSPDNQALAGQWAQAVAARLGAA